MIQGPRRQYRSSRRTGPTRGPAQDPTGLLHQRARRRGLNPLAATPAGGHDGDTPAQPSGLAARPTSPGEGTEEEEVDSHVLNESMIRELAAHRGEQLVTSFYLDVDGRRYPRPSDLEPNIERLFRLARHEAKSRGKDAESSVEGDLAHIKTWLAEGLERNRTRGVAAFSCAAEEFFSAVRLPVSVPDQVSLDRRPHVAPLIVALDATSPCLVVLVDNERSRLLWLEHGDVSESAGPTDEIPRQVDTDVELGSFSRRREEAVRRHLRNVAETLAIELRRRPVGDVVLGGPAAAQLEHQLRDVDARRITGKVDVAMTAPRDEIAAMVRRVVDDLERRRGAELVDKLLQRAGAGGTIGLSSTLDALADKRVATLVVGHGLEAGGFRCAGCGRLGLEMGSCPRCGGTLDEVADLVEAAIDQALGEGADVEFVEVPDFERVGRIGAIERY